MVKRILVCEDDDGVSEMMLLMLQSNGYEAQVCAQGELVQETAQDYCPDLILMDLAMPGLDGRQAAGQLKQHRKTSRIPIVLVSARKELANIAESAPVDGYLEKPFHMADLLAILARY